MTDGAGRLAPEIGRTAWNARLLTILQTEYVGTPRSDNESMILPDLLSMRHILSSHISVPEVNDVTCVPTLGGLSLGGI